MTEHGQAPTELFFFTGTQGHAEPFVRALDAASGQTIWNTPLPKEALFELVLAEGAGRVAVLSGKGHLYVVDRQSGQPLWSVDLPRVNASNYSKGMVTISAGAIQVYLAGYLTGFALDGRQLWRLEGVSVESMGPPAGIVHYDRRGS